MKIIDRVLSHPAFYRALAGLVDSAKLRAISSWRNDFSGLKVLDLGCGPGNSVRLFGGSDYTGIDLNPEYIRAAARRYPGRNFLAGDALLLDWGDGFDVILVNSLLHHLEDRQAEAILGKAAGSLRREGKIIIQEPLRPKDRERIGRLMMKLDRGKHFRSLDGWQRLFERTGWSPEDIRFYSIRLLGLRGYRMVSVTLGRVPEGSSRFAADTSTRENSQI